MKTATFIDRLGLDFCGNVNNNAICFGDVDNDGESELAVGSALGELAIFKGTLSTKCWKKKVDMGHITSVQIGNLCNNGTNVLIVISLEGWCYLLVMSKNCQFENNYGFIAENYNNEDNFEDDDDDFFRQCNNASESENCYTDDTISLSTLGENQNMSASLTKNREDVSLKCFYKQRIPANVKEVLLGDVDGDKNIELVMVLTDRVIRTYRWIPNNNDDQCVLHGRLQPLNKWDFAGQIESVALHFDVNDTPTLLVSQPGGICIKIKSGLNQNNHEIFGLYKNANVSSKIIGNFGQYYAIATLDGNLLIVDDNKIVNRIKVNHQLFYLNKLKLCSSPDENLVVSSWDGYTYIISLDGQVLEFNIGESIAAFRSGYYSLNGRTSPSFAFVTYTNKIYIYYDISALKGINAKSLFKSVDKNKVFLEKISRNNEEAIDNKSKMSEIFRYLAYETES